MGQPLQLVVAEFTDEGPFSLRACDLMNLLKNGGLNMKSCVFMGLIILNGGFSDFYYLKLGI